MKINTNYNNLAESYLFTTVAHKVENFKKNNPDKKVISLGIGDVTKPLCSSVITAMHSAVDDMATEEGFHGYGSEQGYEFLRKAIQKHYSDFNVDLDLDEIFISDGAKSDAGNILDLCSKDNTVLIPDPVYPVYRDTNIMAGRNIIYIDANEENNFLPMPPKDTKADIIYICSPNNPTGALYNREQLSAWVEYAKTNNSLILFDSAYEAFIEGDYPHTIFEIPGSKECTVEICSFSKTAGFTGTRCGYTVVPKNLKFDGRMMNKLWLRRQTTKFNGVAYIVQKGAAAIFTDEGQNQIKNTLKYYKENAKIISSVLDELNIWYTGGKCSPYIWLKCPNNMGSWDFFDKLLENTYIVGTPGEGFGKNGKNFFRLTAFGSRQNTIEASERLKSFL